MSRSKTCASIIDIFSMCLCVVVLWLQLSPTHASSLTEFAFQADTNGLIVIEAESFHANQAGETHRWDTDITIEGFSGQSGLTSLPDSGALIPSAEAPSEAPRLDYRVNFPEAGTYYLWVKGASSGGMGDSIHMGLQGVVSGTADRISSFRLGHFVWTQQTMDGTSVPAFDKMEVNQ